MRSGAAPRQWTRGCAIVLAFAAASAARSAPPPLDVGTKRQLFIDERSVATREGLQMVVHGPRATGEKLLVPDRPWENLWIGGYTSVIQEGDRITGFTEQDADRIAGKSVARAVTWRGAHDLTGLRGKPVSLRYVMRDASPYAFQFR